jgi:ribonuclease BN (tRNA processing enzyme)
MATSESVWIAGTAALAALLTGCFVKTKASFSGASLLFVGMLGAAVVSAGQAAPNPAPGVPVAPADHTTRLILLGTAGGPIPRALRSQPASLLVVDGKPYLIDAGNGVSRQLIWAGFEPADVRDIFITHHHTDHNADLGALISFDWIEDNQRNADSAPPVQIYGPPATAFLVRTALDYLSVSERIFSSETPMVPARGRFEAHDIDHDGLVYTDDRVRVTAVENTHFHIPPSSAAYGKDKSYSYRFDTPNRSFFFTGDTGPSEAVTKLAEGVDVLVTEIEDIDSMMKSFTGKMPKARADAFRYHLEQEHMTPEAVGKMAAEAHVKAVVLTHYTPDDDHEKDASNFTKGVRKYYSGPVIAGRDLLEY